jgi:DNA repair exonuclease SbcCD ATPase subunit
MKTPKELVDKFIKSFGDNEIPIDEMYYNKSESTGINMRSFLEDFAEDISEQTNELQEQLAASNSFLDKRCNENNELSVTIHKLEEQLAAKDLLATKYDKMYSDLEAKKDDFKLMYSDAMDKLAAKERELSEVRDILKLDNNKFSDLELELHNIIGVYDGNTTGTTIEILELINSIINTPK